MPSCACTFDKNYLLGRHGILDLLKIIFGIISWISLISVNWNAGVLSFLLTWVLVSWISTVIFLLMLGFCFECLNTCCAVKWINWNLVLFWVNTITGVVFIAACVCGVIGALSLVGTTSHTGVAVAVSFACFSTVCHFLDAYFYKQQRVVKERAGDVVAV